MIGCPYPEEISKLTSTTSKTVCFAKKDECQIYEDKWHPVTGIIMPAA